MFRQETRADDDEIEADRRSVQPPAARKHLSRAADALLRLRMHGVGACIVSFARFYLDDDEHAILPRRQINLAERRAQTLAKHTIAFHRQPQRSNKFRHAATCFGGAALLAHSSLSSSARA